MSAATPFAHGRLLTTDCRWNMLAKALDDRTDREIVGANGEGTERLRWGSISGYLSNDLENAVRIPMMKCQQDRDAEVISGSIE